MKCTKCGADCDPRQLFCLRCGTPLNTSEIHEDEEEILNNIELTPEGEEETTDLDEEDIDLIIGRDLSRMESRKRQQLSEDIGFPEKRNNVNNELPQNTADIPVRNQKSTSVKKTNNEPGVNKKIQDTHNKISKEQENDEKTKKIIIASIIGGAALILVLVLLFMFFANRGSYDSYIKKGTDLYNRGSVKASIEYFDKAVSLADTTEEKIEANVMLWNAYSQVDGYEKETILVLTELIELDPKSLYIRLIAIRMQSEN